MPHTTRPRTIINDMIVVDTSDTPMWEILVPTQANDGTPFSVRHHRQWDGFVMGATGGMSIAQPMRGSWDNEGTTYRERVIPVRIMCTREQIVAICKETARHYDQLAVIATLISTDTVLVRNPHADNG